MKQITDLGEIKKIELNILIETDRICRLNNIRYSLCGGTLLGAVRHKGFIPWDDDIDIAMPRPDYERFISYCKSNKTNFHLFSFKNNRNYNSLFAKACDKNTIVIDHEADLKNDRFGIWIDIFPVDGLGDTYSEAVNYFNKFEFIKYYHNCSRWTHFYRSKKRSLIYEPIRLFMFLISRFCLDSNKLANYIDKKAQTKLFDDSKYCGCIFGSYGKREVMEQRIFDTYIELEFEGNKFSAFKFSDQYLTNLYGDYMKLPPKEKRISNHDIDVYEK